MEILTHQVTYSTFFIIIIIIHANLSMSQNRLRCEDFLVNFLKNKLAGIQTWHVAVACRDLHIIDEYHWLY